MEDVQNRRDERQLPIDQVGVSDLRYPIVVLDRAQQRQQTVASLTMAVDLPHHFKGTHMSRFVEVLNAYRGEVTMRTLPVEFPPSWMIARTVSWLMPKSAASGRRLLVAASALMADSSAGVSLRAREE